MDLGDGVKENFLVIMKPILIAVGTACWIFAHCSGKMVGPLEEITLGRDTVRSSLNAAALH